MPQLVLVTFADKEPTASYYLFREMRQSLERYGFSPIILGWGLAWGGLGSKPRLLKRAIDDGTITSEWTIWFDAFDVLFAAHPEYIVDVVQQFFSGKVVFNAERAIFPDPSLADRHPTTKSSFRYLNSGFAVGRTADFLKILKWMDADNIPNDSRDSDGRGRHPNDQLLFQQAFVSGELPIALDSGCDICQTLHGVDASELNFDGEFIENRETGSFPAALHANGPAKDSGIMEPILKKLKLR